MYKGVQVKMTPKRWRLQGHVDKRLWNLAALRAMMLLRRRVTVKNVDADGKKIPPLPHKKGWYFESKNAPRSKNQPGAVDRHAPGDPSGKPSLAVVKGGYGRAKTLRGKNDRRDGDFTGTMWDSLTPQIKVGGKKGNKRISLRLYFAKNDKGTALTRVKQKDGSFKRTKTGKFSKRRMRNRDKASYMQTSGAGLQGRVLFMLMEFSQDELFAIRNIVLKNIRLRG